jgi:hypothetical protein
MLNYSPYYTNAPTIIAIVINKAKVDKIPEFYGIASYIVSEFLPDTASIRETTESVGFATGIAYSCTVG